MRKISKSLLVVICMLTLVFSLCGCFDNSNTTETPQGNNNQETEQEEVVVPTTQELSHELAHNSFAIAWGQLDVLDNFEVKYNRFDTKTMTSVLSESIKICGGLKNPCVSTETIMSIVDESDGFNMNYQFVTQVYKLYGNNYLVTNMTTDDAYWKAYGYMEDKEYNRSINSIYSSNSIFYRMTKQTMTGILTKIGDNETTKTQIQSYWKGARDIQTNKVMLEYYNPKFQVWDEDNGFYEKVLKINAVLENEKIISIDMLMGLEKYSIVVNYDINKFTYLSTEDAKFNGYGLIGFDFGTNQQFKS